MTQINLPYSLTEGTTAFAVQVMANLNAIKNAINSGGIETENIAALAVITTKIADAAVTAAKMAADSVTTASIVDLAVTTAKIADNAVTNAKMAADSVGTDEIIALAVGTSELADLAVITAKIADLAVTEAKLGAGAVTNAKLALLAIATGNIQDAAVTLAKMANGSVGTAQLVPLAVNDTKIAASAVTNTKIADGAVAETKLAANAVTTLKVADLAITNAKLALLSIATGNIQDGAVTTAKLADASVTARKLSPDVISDVELQVHREQATLDHPDNSVTDAKIGNRTINDTQAPTGNIGTVTQLFSWLANQIKGITGKTTWSEDSTFDLEDGAAHVIDAVKHITTAERTAWNAKTSTVKGTGTLEPLLWSDLATGDYPFRHQINITGLLSTDYVEISIDKDSLDIAQAAEVCPTCESVAGKVYIYAKTLPTANIPISYIVFK